MISQDTAMEVVAYGERIVVDPFANSKTPYRFQLVQHEQISILALILWDQSNEKGGRTITNSAEQVLRDAIKNCPKIPNMVVYKDQTGRWNRIYCLPDSKSRLRFVSIAPIRKGSPALWEDCLIFNICVEVYQQEQ
jgi:ferredoxin